jgi:hypothetical protein
MNQNMTCSVCESADLVFGTCQSTGALRFRPFGVPFLTFRTADIGVKAGMCPRCGALTLIGDLEKLRQIQQHAAATASSSEPSSAR